MMPQKCELRLGASQCQVGPGAGASESLVPFRFSSQLAGISGTFFRWYNEQAQENQLGLAMYLSLL